ncbi:MAG: DegT/DnrJ/EryC1/StrS family aminotransferase [Armatimonadetes bacterium]|nr:DegT/DnrJ/EryC1/StrS family aminotransferase [Armatimonadota bacterium]
METSSKLAIEGGSPVIQGPLPGWPWFDEEAIRTAVEPLKTGKVNYWTGDIGRQFEDAWADWNGVKYAITTTNGTSALHTAVAALGIGPGDEVIVPSYTFIASSFCIVQAGAIPVFADVCREDHCLDPADIERKITARTRAVIPVHLYGNVCEMDAILSVAEKHDLLVIEDCAQAHGALYKGKKVGTFGHVGCFSFCQSKTFTTGGEGGAVITDDEKVAQACRSFRDHGYDVEKRMSLMELEGSLPYIHTRVGFNYRMTEMQSALGLAQMKRLDDWNLARRRRNGQVLIDALRDVPQVRTLPVHNEEKVNGFFVFPIVLDLDALACDKKAFLNALEAEGAPCWREFWPQCYKEQAYIEHNGFGRTRFPFESKEYTDPASVAYDEAFCPNAAWLEDRTFIVLCHPRLEEEHMKLIADAIKKVAAAKARK